mmetsp:Transcript_14538/g.24161  ORF Transcript_14538/g.24161 Transcript_14538/m.24161 type:complete len:467 (-) Transcript_14538:257-1657(-)
MLFLFLGCNMPFTVLFLVGLGSLLCSFIIDKVEAEPNYVKLNTGSHSLNLAQHPLYNIPIDVTGSGNSPFSLYDEDGYLHEGNTNQNHYQNRGEKLNSHKRNENRYDDRSDNSRKKKKKNGFDEKNELKPEICRHYTCPPTSLETLRKRYGTRRSMWGEWTPAETRQFYKTQLPKALQIDGALGLTLEERAELASASRHALRTYARERCHLPGRLLARVYDGLRHLHYFGSWSASGMTWPEVKEKYRREARSILGEDATEEDIAMFVYRRIVDKSCSTNQFFDQMAYQGVLKATSNRLREMVIRDQNTSNIVLTDDMNTLSTERDLSDTVAGPDYPSTSHTITSSRSNSIEHHYEGNTDNYDIHHDLDVISPLTAPSVFDIHYEYQHNQNTPGSRYGTLVTSMGAGAAAVSRSFTFSPTQSYLNPVLLDLLQNPLGYRSNDRMVRISGVSMLVMLLSNTLASASVL